MKLKYMIFFVAAAVAAAHQQGGLLLFVYLLFTPRNRIRLFPNHMQI